MDQIYAYRSRAVDHFFHWASTEEVKELINEVFSGFGANFVFLEGQKNNCILVSSKQMVKVLSI